jgi:hypothetical protein
MQQKNRRLVICPGVHAPKLSQEFLQALADELATLEDEKESDNIPGKGFCLADPPNSPLSRGTLNSVSPLFKGGLRGNPAECDPAQSTFASWEIGLDTALVFPTDRNPPYSAPAILQFLHQQLSREFPQTWLTVPLVLIGFSAGVVGAVGAAWGWRSLGGKVQTLIALDGWGVPLWGDFPIHRVSHDAFTHWSSALLGTGSDNFYAEPGVEHLDLWRSPHTSHGWQIPADSTQPPIATTAARFIAEVLVRRKE